MGLILFLGIVFILVGLLVHKGNAAAIYTTTGKHGKGTWWAKPEDALAAAAMWRRFHFFLGGSLMAIGMGLYLLVDKTVGLLFAVFYPLAGYVWYFAASLRRAPKEQSLGPTVGIIVITISIVGVLLLMRWGFSSNEILISDQSIEITGPYGEIIRPDDVASVSLVDRLPDIRFKKNGFAVGRIAKGYFRLKNGSTIKLILDGRQGPFLLIRRVTGEELYFTSPGQPPAEVLPQIRRVVPAELPAE